MLYWPRWLRVASRWVVRVVASILVLTVPLYVVLNIYFDLYPSRFLGTHSDSYVFLAGALALTCVTVGLYVAFAEPWVSGSKSHPLSLAILILIFGATTIVFPRAIAGLSFVFGRQPMFSRAVSPEFCDAKDFVANIDKCAGRTYTVMQSRYSAFVLSGIRNFDSQRFKQYINPKSNRCLVPENYKQTPCRHFGILGEIQCYFCWYHFHTGDDFYHLIVLSTNSRRITYVTTANNDPRSISTKPGAFAKFFHLPKFIPK